MGLWNTEITIVFANSRKKNVKLIDGQDDWNRIKGGMLNGSQYDFEKWEIDTGETVDYTTSIGFDQRKEQSQEKGNYHLYQRTNIIQRQNVQKPRKYGWKTLQRTLKIQ